ncbi:hypothetical protein OH77DRAFT_1183400 [Trametes cingulata]|nr:hypothetical protein OH77DRAFT_1183400 [Trametes cingulata]
MSIGLLCLAARGSLHSPESPTRPQLRQRHPPAHAHASTPAHMPPQPLAAPPPIHLLGLAHAQLRLWIRSIRSWYPRCPIWPVPTFISLASWVNVTPAALGSNPRTSVCVCDSLDGRLWTKLRSPDAGGGTKEAVPLGSRWTCSETTPRTWRSDSDRYRCLSTRSWSPGATHAFLTREGDMGWWARPCGAHGVRCRDRKHSVDDTSLQWCASR